LRACRHCDRRRLGAGVAALLLLAAASPALAVDREKGAERLSVPGAPVFFSLQPIVLPVIERNDVTRQVGILLTIELAEGHTAKDAEDKERQLTDAFITELYRIYGWRSGADRVVSEQLIKRRLQAVADQVLGPHVARSVLIRQLVEQER
jgi:hypothetical protein